MSKVQSDVQISVQTEGFRFGFDPLKGQGLSVLILFLLEALLHAGLIITAIFSLWI